MQEGLTQQPSRSRAMWWALSASLALAVPALLAFNLPPSATFLNQAAALVGWGALLAVSAASLPAESATLHRMIGWSSSRHAGLAALLAAFALLLLAAIASPFWTGLPWSLALSAMGLIAAAMLAALVGATLQARGLGPTAFRAFCIGLAVAGIGSSAIGIVQVVAPGWADGSWIARSVLPGRAVGNLRQPNHLSSLLLWALIAAVWLGEARVLKRTASVALVLLFMFVTVLSGSRTGAIGALMLALWGLADRRLSRPARTLLMLMPVIYGVLWAGTAAWAHAAGQVFGGETRFSVGGDVSSSRFGIWSNTLSLIAAHPWAGVGFGEFNFAWTLTPFPDRPVAFFDHTHNLPLHFAVELGLPLACLVLVLLLTALWRAFRNAVQAGQTRHVGQAGQTGRAPAAADIDIAADAAAVDPAALLRAAFMMVLMVGVHSLLEYPLWYAYFLLPASFAFGLCLVVAGPDESAARRLASPASSAGPAGPQATRPLLIGAMLLMCGGLFAVYDYSRVVVIFAPPEGAASLPQRIDAGRRSWFFAHHADYAAATTADHPARIMEVFARAPHYLIDVRLLMAWAMALDDAGDTERARHVAQRLREFRSEQARPFFEICDVPPPSDEEAPFQCVAPGRRLDYRDFR